MICVVVIFFCVILQVKDRLKKYGHLQPLNIFLKQEIDRMQRVIGVVRTTLTDLKLAIDGTIIMSEVGHHLGINKTENGNGNVS